MYCPVNQYSKVDKAWPAPQEIQYMDGTISIVNTQEDPIIGKCH